MYCKVKLGLHNALQINLQEENMNIFSCGGGCNSCLWILILLLIASGCSGNGLEGVLAGSCTPILIALIYSMWKNGTLNNLFCGKDCGCGCN